VATYSVRIDRWAYGWELHVDGVGVTQSPDLANAEDMARSYIAMMTDTPRHSFLVRFGSHVRSTMDT
jgi:hypothetical protein